ncbi:P-loop NTPase fold protein [Bacillus pseudomycoides]|uniref:KAP family P-loop NTPase fold protein n=1 Tax=Bacillus TaxID=1386 RepID=UPI0022489876|nr:MULTISPECIES: P-loop NTPase fold protein [Bacillus]MCX2829586.1 P-loop NTPase fold protein [Bacillus sp. DHT2]MDR4918635.1 P-loop NTPase fold protein [Bacillus pseudomycoides]
MENQSTESGNKRSKKNNIKLILNIIGMYLLGLGIYIIHHDLNEFFEKYFPKTVEISLIYAAPFIILGLILFNMDNLESFFKNIKSSHKFYFFSFFCFLAYIVIFIFKNDNILFLLVFSSLLSISYYFYIEGNFHKSKELKYENEEFDEAIRSLKEDALGRVHTAKLITDILETNPNKNMKIGIYGKWGSGKTSIMNLVELLLEGKKEEKKYIMCRFNPWIYNNEKDLWIGFRKSIEEALILDSKGILDFSLFKNIKKVFLSIFQHSTSKLPIGKLIDELIKNPGTPMQDQIKASINNYLNQSVGENNKIIVFVDDLDRLDDAKMILNVLKTIKEILNINNISYIFAIDDENVSRIIADEMKLPNGHLFLEKIIDYHITIDDPAKRDWEFLLQQEINRLDTTIDKNVIKTIKEYLPSNPRTLKRYMQNMQLLTPILQRFKDEELNLGFIYLGQLLKSELPDVYREIIKDKEAIGKLSPSAVDPNKMITEKDAEVILKQLPVQFENTGRAKKIITGLLRHINKMDRNFNMYFRVIENSNVLTLKEFQLYYQKIHSDAFEFNKLESDYLKTAYIERLFINREDLVYRIKHIQYLDMSKEIQQNLEILENHIEELIPILNSKHQIKILELLYRSLKNYINNNDPLYSEIRQREMDIIKNISKLNLNNHYTELLEIIDLWDFEIDKLEYFKEFKKDLIKMIEPPFIDELISRFRTVNGLKLWYKNAFPYEKYYLFNKSAFHQNDTYQKLNILAEESKSDRVIRLNFLEYMWQFVHYSKENQNYTKIDDVKEVLENETFLQILWKGVTSEEINEYSLSIPKDFEELVKEIHKEQGNDIFDFPDWWRNKEAQLLS